MTRVDQTKVFTTLGASNHSEGTREKDNYYSTNPKFIDDVLSIWPHFKDVKDVLEPCAGEGMLVDRWFELTGNRMDCFDLVQRRADIPVADYFTANVKDQYDLIITNPPYNRDSKNAKQGLCEIILKMLDDVRVGGSVILFLKTVHLESAVRYDKIYSKYPPSTLAVYSNRMKCYKGGESMEGASAISYAIYSWENKREDGTFDSDTKLMWIR